jgi:hypothetical protein
MSAVFLRLLLSSPAGENNTEAYAFELQEYKDIKKDLPMYGDLITHIVVKTSKMPKWMTFYSTHGWSRMAPVQCVAPEWYLIYFAGGINATNYLQTDGFPQDSKIYINWAFINRVSPRSDNKTGHMFAPPLQPNILSLSHTERMMTMSHITHISWDKNTTSFPLKLNAHGITIFEILDADHKKALETITGGYPIYNLGSGILPCRMGINDATLTINTQTKPVNAFPSKL